MASRQTCSFSGRTLPEIRPLRLHEQTCSTRSIRRSLASQKTRAVRRAVKCSAAAETQVGRKYNGQFGEWTLEESDRQEVLGYRTGLSLAAVAAVVETAIALEGDAGLLRGIFGDWQNFIIIFGAASLGISMHLIHIYVKPLKQFMQLMYLTGTLAAVYFAASQGMALPAYIGEHHSSLWLIGPFFAAITGLAFKEGICYGKLECAALFFVTPAMIIGDMSGLLSGVPQQVVHIIFAGLFAAFAAGKWSQPIKDDIGDKSVFEFLALPEEEQQAREQQIGQ
ncbi:hypothetical protein WJX74_010628 [Apatococcus lobatus]|uniref:Uncharacterized protein n=2 Tax=Apatococcus TaxID=904362 RepID=A0AAW1SMN6_9CHLO